MHKWRSNNVFAMEYRTEENNKGRKNLQQQLQKQQQWDELNKFASPALCPTTANHVRVRDRWGLMDKEW